MKHTTPNPENITAHRVYILRRMRGLSQKELAERLYVSASQISRLESGETTNINHELLVSLAKEFTVSTDYLLGLTQMRVPRNYELSQLGLSEEVVRRLMLKEIDPDVVNRLLEHKDFPKLSRLMRNYFDGTTAEGILSRNRIIDLATEPMAELMQSDPAKKAELLHDLKFLNSQKVQENEADIEKIKGYLLKILRDAKAGMQTQTPAGPIATNKVVADLLAALPDRPRSELTAEDVASAIVACVGAAAPMDEETAALLRQLSKRMLEQEANKAR